ncbi:MAG: hypothetical protein U0W40_20280 [Acidimicrobiia bacterium]
MNDVPADETPAGPLRLRTTTSLFAVGTLVLLVLGVVGVDPVGVLVLALVMIVALALSYVVPKGRRPHLERRVSDGAPVRSVDDPRPAEATIEGEVVHHARLTPLVQVSVAAFATACFVAGIVGLLDGLWSGIVPLVLGAGLAYATGWKVADTLTVDAGELHWRAPFRRGSCPLEQVDRSRAWAGRVGMGSPVAILTLRGQRSVLVWRDRDLPAFLESVGVPYTGR